MNVQLANRITDRILYEQMMPNATRKAQGAFGWSDADIETAREKSAKRHAKSLSKFWDEYKHEIVQVAALGALMTGVGAPLYVALQAVDAGMYVAEGDRYGAAMTVGFALIPGAGRIGKAAAVRALGPKGMAKLGAKVARAKATKRLVLSKAEKAAFKVISANKQEVAQIMRNGAKKLATSKAGKATGLVAKGVKGTAKFAAKAGAGYGAVSAVVDPLYKSVGWEDKDIEDQIGADEILSGLK